MKYHKDIWIEILQYIPILERKWLNYVSLFFREILKEPTLWKSIYLQGCAKDISLYLANSFPLAKYAKILYLEM
jgi:hypothetical protein